MSPDAPPFALWLTEFVTPYDACCHGIVEVLHREKTAFQDMMIVASGAYGKALVLDGYWQSSTADEFLYHEPLVHPACVIQGGPGRVLILGGGEGAALREVLKWNSVQEAVMVDLDGQVVEACREYLPEMHQGAFEDPRAQVVIADAFDFIEHPNDPWDLIISDLTDPVEEGPSANLFTMEYFRKCHQALAPGGCFVLQAGLAGPVEMNLHIRLIRTVSAVFETTFHYVSHVPSWSSPMGFVLGTNKKVDLDGFTPGGVDLLLGQSTNGVLRMFDGYAFQSLIHPPKYLRDAVAGDTTIFTLADPPKAL